jgi:hypothetical protein
MVVEAAEAEVVVVVVVVVDNFKARRMNAKYFWRE